MAHDYNSQDIKILEGLEAVRVRPGMYIGSTGPKGLHHILWEIVDNAIDEAANGFADKVEIILYKDGSVSVEDNGRGIAQKDIPYIFDRFYRGDASRNSATGGSGIGLSIVRKIIEDHGGKIWATSKEGTGTIMYFVIRKYIEEVKEIVNVSPQETAVAGNLTVRENLEFIAGVYDVKDSDRIEKIISEFKFEEIINQRAKTLSGGWQRRLSIAMALISDPEILFLDEPTLGLDVIARRELWKIIKGLKGHKTIILTTHYMEEAEALADNIAIMKAGRIIASGSAQELIEKAGTASFEDAFVKLVGGEL